MSSFLEAYIYLFAFKYVLCASSIINFAKSIQFIDIDDSSEAIISPDMSQSTSSLTTSISTVTTLPASYTSHYSIDLFIEYTVYLIYMLIVISIIGISSYTFYYLSYKSVAFKMSKFIVKNGYKLNNMKFDLKKLNLIKENKFLKLKLSDYFF